MYDQRGQGFIIALTFRVFRFHKSKLVTRRQEPRWEKCIFPNKSKVGGGGEEQR